MYTMICSAIACDLLLLSGGRPDIVGTRGKGRLPGHGEAHAIALG